MDAGKRAFLGATAGLGAAPLLAQGAPLAVAGPALLTVTGNISRVNRGPFDPALDQMMHKQKISFARAFSFDFATLLRLPAATIRPTLEYDGKVHALRGPLLIDVLATAGAPVDTAGKATLRAVDGYAVELSFEQLRRQRYIVATHLDGKPMALGGLGPLWAVVDADRIGELAARPVTERFGQCPWALYHVSA